MVSKCQSACSVRQPKPSLLLKLSCQPEFHAQPPDMSMFRMCSRVICAFPRWLRCPAFAVYRIMIRGVPVIFHTKLPFDRRAESSHSTLHKPLLLQLQHRKVDRRITPSCTAQQTEKPTPVELVVGIDLGTTNSAVAVSVRSGKLTC